MPPKPGSDTTIPLWIGLASLLVGVVIPLGLVLVALALPSVFATYNAVPVGQMLAVVCVVAAGYLFLRTPIWVRSQQRRYRQRDRL